MSDTIKKDLKPTAKKAIKPKKPKVPRQAMPEQKPEDRKHNFNEVPFGYTSEIAMLEGCDPDGREVKQGLRTA